MGRRSPWVVDDLMLFATFDFLVFVVPVLIAAWALTNRPTARVTLLLLASYFFYMAGPKTDPPPPAWYFVGLVMGSTLLDYGCGLGIAALDRRKTTWRTGLLVASLVGNLGLLGYFKYSGFFVDTFADLSRWAGVDVAVPVLEITLPVGISFYTFQSLSYTIDVWRGRLAPERSLLRFAFFVTFFPQLVAGPIVRAAEFMPQLDRRPRLSREAMTAGLFRIYKGLIKKVAIGDWIAARFTDAVFAAPENYTSEEIMVALYAFTLQLYVDFSGYSDIAIGVSRLFGYTIPENFDRPHQSRNLGEFWRRWHMTLSMWLRDYLFFPLGGSRGAPLRVYFNLWLTMFLVGMWHYIQGTSWNFVIYANLQAFAMVFSRWNRMRERQSRWALLRPSAVGFAGFWLIGTFALAHYGLGFDRSTAVVLGFLALATFYGIALLPETNTLLNTAIHVALTFHFTVVSRIFFRSETFESAVQMIHRVVACDFEGVRPGLIDPTLASVLVLGIAVHFTPKRWVDRDLYGLFRRLPGPVLGLGLGLLGLGLMTLMSGQPRAFIYFQF